jgi:hypothetical protein
LKLAFVFVGIFATALIAIRTRKTAPEQTLLWLNPSQYTSATSPGPVTRLKYKVMNLTSPLWQRFRRAKKQVLVEAQFEAIPAGVGEPPGLGPPFATNSDGTLAWILSPSNLTNFQSFLHETPLVGHLGRPRIQTIDGMQAGVFMGNAAPNVGRGGVGVDVTATIVSPAIRLLVKAQATEPAESGPGSPVPLKTNLTVACRVLVPNGGALALRTGNPKDSSGTNHWLIISPTAMDARGKPIQPQTPPRVIKRNAANDPNGLTILTVQRFNDLTLFPLPPIP